MNKVPMQQGMCKFLWKQSKDAGYREIEEHGSSVFKMMLDEVCDICQWSVKKDNEERWSPKPIKQVFVMTASKYIKQSHKFVF